MAPAAAAATDPLRAARCAIYVSRVEHSQRLTSPHLLANAAQHGWAADQYSAEHWVAAALEAHPWRTDSLDDADLVLFVSNYTWLCSQRDLACSRARGPCKTQASAAMVDVRAQVGRSTLPTRARPGVIVNTNNAACGNRVWHPHVVTLVDSMRARSRLYHQHAVLPYVVSRAELSPGSALLAQLAAVVPKWRLRPLLSFSGHVPKPHTSPRYEIWRQVRAAADVTARSHSLRCNAGYYHATCAGAMALGARAAREATQEARDATRRFQREEERECHRWCYWNGAADGVSGPFGPDGARYTYTRLVHNLSGGVAALTNNTRELPPCRGAAIELLRSECGAMRRRGGMEIGGGGGDSGGGGGVSAAGVAEAALLDDIWRLGASRERSSYAEWAAEAFRNRFCLVSRGDYPQTPKLADFVMFGAAGGCLPVVVLMEEPSRTLPYMGWLDYCDVAYLVSEAAARRNMSAVLTKLRAVTAAEAAAKRRRLSQVRDAFFWPHAADYALAEACEAARMLREFNRTRTKERAANRWARCLLDS